MKYSKGFLSTLAIMAGLSLIDYLHLYGVSTKFDGLAAIGQKIGAASTSILWAAGVPALMFFVVWLIYINTKNIKSLFLEFLFPLTIAAYTLIAGTYGFCQMGDDLGNSIFNAANLLTLNSSVFPVNEINGVLQPVNLWLVNARLAGGFFLAYAFFLAFSFATGRENISRLKFWIKRRTSSKPFYVVIGDTKKALFLALDLEKAGKKVVFQHQEADEAVEAMLEGKNIYYMNGNPTSRTGLEKTYFERAEKVYILNESDDKNFRVCQEMIEIMTETKTVKGNWFVSMHDLRKRTLLTQLMDVLPQTKVQILDLHQNVARRIVLINDQKALADPEIEIYQNVIFGFNELATAITMQLLRIGHFNHGKRLHIQVFYEKKDVERVENFKETHPELFPDNSDSENFAALKEYTFLSSGPILEFLLLPKAESKLTRPEFILYDLIKPTAAVNLYVCLDNGLDSASLLTTLLPRINHCDTKYIKSYCYYNYLDELEEKMIQEKLFKITNKAIPVFCFGNDMGNCKVNAIENEERDILAKYIAYLYDRIYNEKIELPENQQQLKGIQKDLARFGHIKSKIGDWKIDKINQLWDEETKEIDKESNRQAADHALIKFALMGKELKDIVSADQYLVEDDKINDLAEVEHRRWNAEKLLVGWLPTQEGLTNATWLDNKKALRNQKFHFHLTDYHQLPPEEKGKDHTQIMGLPYFIKTIYTKKKLL